MSACTGQFHEVPSKCIERPIMFEIFISKCRVCDKKVCLRSLDAPSHGGQGDLGTRLWFLRGGEGSSRVGEGREGEGS